MHPFPGFACDEGRHGQWRRLLWRLQHEWLDGERKKVCLVEKGCLQFYRRISTKKWSKNIRRNHRTSCQPKIYIWLNAHKQDSLDPKFVFFSSCRAVCHSHSIVQIHFFVKWHVSNAHQLLNRATDSLKTEASECVNCITLHAPTNLLDHVIVVIAVVTASVDISHVIIEI